jgi:hypothetical protein
MKDEDDKTGKPGPMQTDLSTRKVRGRLGRDVQNKLGQQLRTSFDEIVNQGIPKEWDDFLRKLDEPKGSA